MPEIKLNFRQSIISFFTPTVLPDMKANRRGMIVNVSSGSELQPDPYMALYGATKTFVRNFTLGK